MKLSRVTGLSSQEEYPEEDPENPCTNYPNQLHQSYAECDDQFVRSSLPDDFAPFWSLDDMSQATTNYTVSRNASDKLDLLMGSYIQSGGSNSHTTYCRGSLLRVPTVGLSAVLSQDHGHGGGGVPVHQ